MNLMFEVTLTDGLKPYSKIDCAKPKLIMCTSLNQLISKGKVNVNIIFKR